MELGGLHHVTAVTGDAPRNLDFYTRVLGLRLVKKTVNQDDVSAYHLFYGDEVGGPGTEVTFFDWAGMGPNLPGSGGIVEIGLRVPDRAALDWWAKRFDELGVAHSDVEEIAGRPTLRFTDPEQQHLALVAGGNDAEFTPWRRSPVPVEHQIRGLDHVTLAVDRLAPTERVLTEVLNFRRAGDYPSPDNPSLSTVVFETGPGGAGTEVRVEERPDLPPTDSGVAASITSRSARLTIRSTAPGATACAPPASASPTSSIATTSSRSISGSPAACCSKSRPMAPASPPTRTRNTWGSDWRCRPSWSPTGPRSKPG